MVSFAANVLQNSDLQSDLMSDMQKQLVTLEDATADQRKEIEQLQKQLQNAEKTSNKKNDADQSTEIEQLQRKEIQQLQKRLNDATKAAQKDCTNEAAVKQALNREIVKLKKQVEDLKKDVEAEKKNSKQALKAYMRASVHALNMVKRKQEEKDDTH
jgi:hypothetical protein